MAGQLIAATSKDVPYIQSILNDPANLDKLGAATDERIANALADPHQTLHFWEADGNRKGMMWLVQDAASPDAIKIEEFGMTERGGGHGSAFLQAVVGQMAQMGIQTIWLYVAADNAAAIGFYEKHGFAQTDRWDSLWERRKGAPVEAIRMERTIHA